MNYTYEGFVVGNRIERWSIIQMWSSVNRQTDFKAFRISFFIPVVADANEDHEQILSKYCLLPSTSSYIMGEIWWLVESIKQLKWANEVRWELLRRHRRQRQTTSAYTCFMLMWTTTKSPKQHLQTKGLINAQQANIRPDI